MQIFFIIFFLSKKIYTSLFISSFITLMGCDLWKMENKKKLREYKRKYEIYRHHAWAGTVLLSVLLAIRIFLEMAENRIIPEIIFIILGALIAFYTLGALFFTYRYRRALVQKELEINQKTVDETLASSSKTEKNQAKQQYKIIKKKVKNQVKKEKKSTK